MNTLVPHQGDGVVQRSSTLVAWDGKSVEYGQSRGSRLRQSGGLRADQAGLPAGLRVERNGFDHLPASGCDLVGRAVS
jgi:hypothetical protein